MSTGQGRLQAYFVAGVLTGRHIRQLRSKRDINVVNPEPRPEPEPEQPTTSAVVGVAIVGKAIVGKES